MLRGLADADEDKRGAADYDTRAPATQAALESHIDLEAAATSKEEHVNDCVGGGDEDSVVYHGGPGEAEWERGCPRCRQDH